MQRRYSIRWRLALSYAALALLTVLALGAVLMLTLRSYYLNLEQQYLARNASVVAAEASLSLQRDLEPAILQAQIESLAFVAGVRIRLFNTQNQLLIDSGSPANFERMAVQVEQQREALDVMSSDQFFWTIAIAPSEVSNESLAEPQEDGASLILPAPLEGGPPPLPIDQETDVLMILPAEGTLYGFDLLGGERSPGIRSDQNASATITMPDGMPLGHVELSEGPAYGREILLSVVRGLAFAGLAAVLIAGAAGWLISQRISTPLLTLSATTSRMAEGDLSVRVDLDRQDEIGLLARSFNEMAARIQEMVDTLRQVVADAAHELNTPLTALHSQIEMLSTESDPVRQAAALLSARSQLQRMEIMAADLLTLSRLESGVMPVLLTPLDLKRLLHELAEVYASRAEVAGLDFELRLPSEPVFVNGSESQLRRALGCLLDNAGKFTPAGGKVSLALHMPTTAQVEIEITDTGIGILPEDRPHLFERFYRGRAVSDYPGSGLGLAIARVIIDSHAGDLHAAESDQGARFVVALPRALP